MTEKMMKFVLNFRLWIYGVGIAAIIISSILHATPYYPDETEEYTMEDPQAFWPPDMVPHPNPPWDQPKDNDEGDLA